ncbi:NADH-dependent flavin oxidoreductase [Ligilactobacillus murinus]|uniref:NADH-dependent flavin oxidoreductase n=1 Tax=Ligilactobacillus murinus TaxID=1622 RepID=UPI00296AB8B3|nr:NADH-dependent flavin oxidoreductase [Ligilactobacillus murinus]WOY88612.1 NADH-dependent flavin oxidoreductase [Ligilactobacillus murinus]
MRSLSEKISLKKQFELNNRLVMAPMTTWSSNDDHTISTQELTYYARRNRNLGMVITGCTHVSTNGIGFTHEFGGYDDKFVPGLTKLANTIKQNGAKAILQINHAGNKALKDLVPNGDVVSASAVTTSATAFVDSLTPRELTDSEIYTLIKAFGETTRRAIEAGFDGIEVHGAHSFLIQNFLSPHFNQRSDSWGKDRFKFALAVFQEIASVVEKYADRTFVIGWRISPEENLTDGLKVNDTLRLANKLIELGVDYLHLSLADAVTDTPSTPEITQTYIELFAEIIQKRVPLIVAGQIKDGLIAQQALALGADLVAVGHGLITDPDWSQKVLNDQNNKLQLKLVQSNLAKLDLPDKLWEQIKNSGPWFEII